MTGGPFPAARTPAPAYDFFATARPAGQTSPTAAASSAASPYATARPSDAPATNQFGTPLHLAPPPQWQPPAASAPVPTRPTVPPWLLRVGIGLAVALVLGAFGVGRFAGIGSWLQGDLEAPETLGGMPQTGSSELGSAAGFLAALAGPEVDEDDVALAAYGDVSARGAVLVALRGDAAPAEEDPAFVAAALGVPDARVVGSGACGEQQGVLLCAVLRDDLLTAVVVPAGTTDLEVVALALEAHRAMS